MQSTPRLVALVLLLGLSACAARTTNVSASGAGGVPPLPPGASAAKWDHYCAFFESGQGYYEKFGTLLAEASEHSWEMVSATDDATRVMVCFKRPTATPTTIAPGVGRPSDIVLPPPTP